MGDGTADTEDRTTSTEVSAKIALVTAWLGTPLGRSSGNWHCLTSHQVVSLQELAKIVSSQRVFKQLSRSKYFRSMSTRARDSKLAACTVFPDSVERYVQQKTYLDKFHSLSLFNNFQYVQDVSTVSSFIFSEWALLRLRLRWWQRQLSRRTRAGSHGDEASGSSSGGPQCADQCAEELLRRSSIRAHVCLAPSGPP